MALINWFCKSDIPTTFYILREQCSNKKRISKDETIPILYESMNGVYKDSCLIVHNFTFDKKFGLYDHSEHLEELHGEGIVVKDIFNKSKLTKSNPAMIVEKFANNIFEHGVRHGICSMYNVLHIVTYLGYRNIIFVGVDLNDSRYFWLRENQSRYTLKAKKKDYSSRHPIYKDTMQLVKVYQQVFPDVDMKVHSEGSALTECMGIFDGKK